MSLLTAGLWDLAGWVKDDAYDFVPVRTSVEPERLEHWIDRAEQFVDIVSGIFPGTFMVWRTLHYCVVYPSAFNSKYRSIGVGGSLKRRRIG
jgi:hypothetical protein